ncbi:MAG TPA: protein translocase subunit SecF [Arachnia sp.]|nr:protein translocase subunit SecF [Arachnia sp.]HMR12338.1 protein translocase subunit SecF [Arachnia sp.]
MSGKKLGIAGRLYTGQLSYDFMKNRKLWFIISGVIIGASVLALLIRGLTLGIEFTGGTDFQAPMAIQAGTVDQVREKVAEIDVPELEAQVFSLGDTNIRVQTRSLSPDETSVVRAAIADIAGVEADEVAYNAIGASWGKTISQRGLVALVVFMGLVMLLIAAYFRDWKMSIAAIVAVVHDLLLTIGAFALLGFTVTPSTIIGVLTILGYSLYDTVVVFDKIRENVRGLTETNKTYSYQANLAVNQVVIRSVNTTIIGVLPVLALFIAGTWLQSGPLADLGLALLVGMIAGAYSSLFVAAPLLAWLREREPDMVEHRERLARRAARAEHKRAAHEAQLAEAGVSATDAAADVVPGARTQRRTASSRAERKGKK